MNFLRLRRTPKLAVPKHETEILFADADGVLKQMGPDGSVVEVGSGGGGGSIPVYESAYYSGSTVETAGFVYLPFDILDTGADLLDVTDPTNPAARKAGLFIVTAQVQQTGLPPDVLVNVALILDYGGDNAEVDATVTGETDLLITGQYVLDVGGVFRVSVTAAGPDTASYLIKNATIARIGPA